MIVFTMEQSNERQRVAFKRTLSIQMTYFSLDLPMFGYGGWKGVACRFSVEQSKTSLVKR
jgi:hypothetical protein